VAAIKMPIEASHVMMFARAIGETNPAYLNGEAVPPTFLQAVAQFDPDYYLRPKPGQAWFGSGATPSGVEGKAPSSGGLHAEQHFEYLRPVRPGDVLSVEYIPGKTWEKESRRAGKLTFRERIAEYRDQSGALVCRATSVGVTTERPVEQG
jgi:hypothetical protein